MGIRKILAKVGSYFSKKPKPRPLPAPVRGSIFRHGHRGTAAGSVANPDLSPENIAKWRALSETTARDFLSGEPLFVHSTNVVMAQYFPVERKMMVEFKKGRVYMYSEVTEGMAWEFLQAASKGHAIWQLFRVLGSKTAHKVPYVRLR